MLHVLAQFDLRNVCAHRCVGTARIFGRYSEHFGRYSEGALGMIGNFGAGLGIVGVALGIGERLGAFRSSSRNLRNSSRKLGRYSERLYESLEQL